MSTPTHPKVPLQKITCRVCLEEVPLNLVDTPEGSDYIGHFCGIECYAEFNEKLKAETATPSARGQK